MTKIPLPSPALLRQLLQYDAATGWLYWKERGPEMFVNPAYQGRWNKRYAERRAFTTLMPNGYYVGRVQDVPLYAHRVVWAMVNGALPPDQVDHINGVKTDNRASNLRAVSHRQNQMNMKRSKANTSGCTGVYRHSQTGSWQAKIKINYRYVQLGSFATFDDAVAARKAAERQHGFHPNHGRSA